MQHTEIGEVLSGPSFCFTFCLAFSVNNRAWYHKILKSCLSLVVWKAGCIQIYRVGSRLFFVLFSKVKNLSSFIFASTFGQPSD